MLTCKYLQPYISYYSIIIEHRTDSTKFIKLLCK